MYPGWHLGGAKGASDDATLVVLKRTHSIEVLKFFIDYNMLLTYVNPLPDEQHFMLLNFDAFWCTKSNKFAILVNFPYFV